MKKTTVRYFIERLYCTAVTGEEIYTRECSGIRTLAAAKQSLRSAKQRFTRADFRIVKFTTTREVVK